MSYNVSEWYLEEPTITISHFPLIYPLYRLLHPGGYKLVVCLFSYCHIMFVLLSWLHNITVLGDAEMQWWWVKGSWSGDSEEDLKPEEALWDPQTLWILGSSRLQHSPTEDLAWGWVHIYLSMILYIMLSQNSCPVSRYVPLPLSCPYCT